MREIKFRAFVKEINEIINVDKVNFQEKYITRYSDNLPFPTLVKYPFEDVELLQYTGLKDKNGKEIYEGDICRYEDRAGSVVFDKGSFSLHTNLGKGAVGCLDIGIFRNACEVIGNIYENPELLEVI